MAGRAHRDTSIYDVLQIVGPLGAELQKDVSENNEYAKVYNKEQSKTNLNGAKTAKKLNLIVV